MFVNTATENRPFMYCAAAAAIGMALCYLSMFMLFFLVLQQPSSTHFADKVRFIADNRALISLGYSSGYLLLGVFLLITVQALQQKMQLAHSNLLNTGSWFGIIWVMLMMASGMVQLVGIETMLRLHDKGSLQAEALFYSYNTIVNGLGGGIELVGGLWVLLVSIAGLRHRRLSAGLHWLGIVVGMLGILTLLPLTAFKGLAGTKELFGFSQIIWFIWLGILLKPSALVASSSKFS